MKADDKKISVITAGLLIAVWCAVILILGNVSELGFSGWFCFLFVPVCVATVYCCVNIYKPVKNDSAAVALPIHYSLVLIFLAIIINAVYILAGNKAAGPPVIVVDILLLAAYLAITLFSHSYRQNLSNRMGKAEKATAFSVSFSRELGAILAQTADPSSHKAVAELKEIVDYSANSARGVPDEAPILLKLEELKIAVSNKESSEKISSLASELTSLWKVRNTRL